jgi:hypothetical protein
MRIMETHRIRQGIRWDDASDVFIPMCSYRYYTEACYYKRIIIEDSETTKEGEPLEE